MPLVSTWTGIFVIPIEHLRNIQLLLTTGGQVEEGKGALHFTGVSNVSWQSCRGHYRAHRILKTCILKVSKTIYLKPKKVSNTVSAQYTANILKNIILS